MKPSNCEVCGADLSMPRQVAITMFGLRPLCLECAEVEVRPAVIDCGLEFEESRVVAQEVMGVCL